MVVAVVDVASFDADADDVDTVTDVVSPDKELGILSNCDDGRFSDFLLFDSDEAGVVNLLPLSDRDALELWPI